MTMRMKQILIRNSMMKWRVSTVSQFSTQALTSYSSSSGASETSLFNRIQPVRDPRVSVIPILDQWVDEGKPLNKTQLQTIIYQLRGFKKITQSRFRAKWMTDRRYLTLSPSDVAVEMDLISRVHGLEHAEIYFNSTSSKLKTSNAYGALLRIYVREKCVAKAEATMQEMGEMGLVTTSFPYNMLINLYGQVGLYGKIEVVMQEMDTSRIPHDKFTLRNLLNAYVLASDIPSMEKILKQIENDHDYRIDWKIYSLATHGYLKVGLVDNALSMLKKMEVQMPYGKFRIDKPFEHLVSFYASIGDKSEVQRVWDKYNALTEELTTSYSVMITSLAKMDDIEGAEKFFEEWESKCSSNYDFRVLNRLLSAYCRKGHFVKAEAIVKKASEGRTPLASTWNILANGYMDHEQMEKSVEMFKKALSVGGERWMPNSIILDAYLKYIEGKGDVEGMEEMIGLLKISGSLSRDIYHRLLRTCIVTDKYVSGVLERMEMDGFTADEETRRILDWKI